MIGSELIVGGTITKLCSSGNAILAIAAALALGAWQTSPAQFPAIVQLSTLDGANGFRLDGAAAGDRAGFSVSAAGDINGDGIDDLIIGADRADPNGDASGASYVVFGKDTSTHGLFPATLALSELNGSNGFRLDGATAGSFSGHAVSAAGDINGDGIDDLIVGAYRADTNGSFSGSSYVVFGRDTATQGPFPATLAVSDLNGSDGFRLDGVAAFDRSGYSVSNAGDVNGDGIDDLIVGALLADTNGDASGASFVVFGKDTTSQGPFPATLALFDLDGSDGFRLDGAAVGDFSGRSVSAAGDINGDGIDDLIVGADRADPNGNLSGSSFVVFGKDTSMQGPFPATLALSDLNGSDGFRLDGAGANHRAGRSVSAAGDINGDGIDDLIVGADRADPNGDASGASYVVFGKDTSTHGPFPATLALSDLNGSDGFRLEGAAAGDHTGSSVSAAGDINGDGIDDLIIGADRAAPNGDASGASHVVFGKDTSTQGPFPATLSLSNLSGSDGFRLDGEAADDRSGHAVSAAGDINGDGIDDLIVGAFGADFNGTVSGAGYVVFGRPTPDLTLLPNPLDFGSVAMGSTVVRMLTVENTGSGTLVEPGTVSIQGNHAGDFTTATNNCTGEPLTSGASCDIDIGFSPSAPGIRQATLLLESNASTSPDAVELIGTSDVVFSDSFEGKFGSHRPKHALGALPFSSAALPAAGYSDSSSTWISTVSTLSAGMAPVLATGQLATFATGDDGDLRHGFPWPNPRFTNNGDGTVTDELTGLMWTRDAHLDASAGPRTWEGALALVEELNDGSIGGYIDWRLPNINELESLVDYGRFSHALPQGHTFVNVQPEGSVAPGAEPLVSYWSSTPAISPGIGPTVALTKSFQSGSTFPQARNPVSGPERHVWAVRGGNDGLVMLPGSGWTDAFAPGDDGDTQHGLAWCSPRLEQVPDANGVTGNVVLDRLTGLIWTREISLHANASWPGALTAVQDMNAGTGTFGYTDWRLPNARELRSILDYSQTNPPLPQDHPFLGAQPIPYWSSTTYAGNTNLAGVVSMELASDLRSFELKGTSYGVWAVRSKDGGDARLKTQN